MMVARLTKEMKDVTMCTKSRNTNADCPLRKALLSSASFFAIDGFHINNHNFMRKGGDNKV